MSLKQLSLISAVHMNGQKDKDGQANFPTRPPVVPVQGVNVVLGGAMMSGIIIMVFLICYCCHRNQQKRQTNLPRYWRDPGLAMEVYTVDGQQLFEIPEDIPSRPVSSGPPPSYEAVVHGYHDKDETSLHNFIRSHREDDAGLPSYEAALQMAHDEGRVV